MHFVFFFFHYHFSIGFCLNVKSQNSLIYGTFLRTFVFVSFCRVNWTHAFAFYLVYECMQLLLFGWVLVCCCFDVVNVYVNN